MLYFTFTHNGKRWGIDMHIVKSGRPKMKSLGLIGDHSVELFVCDDGVFVLRGGLFMDDLVRLTYKGGQQVAQKINAEVARREKRKPRNAKRAKK